VRDILFVHSPFSRVLSLLAATFRILWKLVVLM